MSLTLFKWIAAAVIFATSLTAGLISLHVINKRKRLFLLFGNAVANGVFLGAAFFHLLPDAVGGFKNLGISFVYPITLGLIICSFTLLVLIERSFRKHSPHMTSVLHAWLLTATLSVHAIIAGMALGIAASIDIVSVVFVAIIAHKGFETFALVMNLSRQLRRTISVVILLLLFSCITPLGIGIGSLGDYLLSPHTDSLLTAILSAFASGTFIYIGSAHVHVDEERERLDSHQKYAHVLAMLAGAAVMAVLAIWV